MTVRIQNVTFDCADTEKLATFWSEALGIPIDPDGDESVRTLNMSDPNASPNWLFLQVPEPKTAKNRMHLDLEVDDREAEVARLVSLGATHVADKNEWDFTWAVLQDPEGNEFCVVTPFH